MSRTSALFSAVLLLSACDTQSGPSDDKAEAIEASISLTPILTADSDDDASTDAAPSAGQGLADDGAMHQLPGFDMDIALADADITLEWEDVGGPYNVWRSTEAYFAPGDAGSTQVGSGVQSNTFTDVGGNDDTAYYYVVTAADTSRSTTTGKFVHYIVPGYNKVSQPLITGSTSGEEFNASFAAGESWGNPYIFDAKDQHYKRSRPHKGWDFEYGPGECPIMQHRSYLPPYHKKFVGHVPDYGEMGVELYEGHNYVTLPLWYGDMLASDLLDALPADAAIASILPTGLGEPYSAEGGDDFLISAGACIAVTTTDDAAWPPPYDAKKQLSSGFEDGIPQEYEIHNEDLCSYYAEDGELIMAPGPNTVWYAQEEGCQLGQPVSGDFSVTARIAVTTADGQPVAPGDSWKIGALMVRDAEQSPPATYHCGLGNGNNDNEPQFEYKSTVAGVSELDFTAWPSGIGDVRICRVGGVVQGLLKQDGVWTVIDSRERNDLGESLEAGPIAYSDNADPDMLSRFDFISVKSVTSLEDCLSDEGDDFADTPLPGSNASDANN